MEAQASICIVCGVESQWPATATAETSEPAQSASGLFTAGKSVEDGHLTGISGWLFFTAISLTIMPFLNLFTLANDCSLFFNSAASEYLASHSGLYLLILFEMVSNLVFIFFSVILNALFYAKRVDFPVAMIVFLVVNVLVISIDHIGVVQMDFNEKSTQLVRALLAAAIWIPYFLRSRRVALTFVH